MREVVTRCKAARVAVALSAAALSAAALSAVALCAAALLLSCASSKPASEPGARESDRSARSAPAAERPSIDEARFIARHAAILEALSPLESSPLSDPRTIETRSILSGAEEMYLRGKTQIALELLGEAEAALKRGD